MFVKKYLLWYSSSYVSDIQKQDNGTMHFCDTQVTSTTTSVQLLKLKSKGPDVWLVMIIGTPQRLLHFVNLPFLRWNLRCIENKCLQCHVKSMFTMQQKAETKMILIICKVHLRNFLNRCTTQAKNTCSIRIHTIQKKINYLPPVQDDCSFAWDQMAHEYQWMVIIVNNETISIQEKY